METQIETFWIFALLSKFKSLSSLNTIFIFIFLWFALSICYWLFPGGPAWGKHYWLKHRSVKTRKTKLIPGPRGVPVLGSFNLMTNLAHHKLAAAASHFKAKKLMAFSVGESRFIVTSNPGVAKEMLNSSVFADRPVKESAYRLMFNRAIGFAPYGVYWRTLRRIAANHLFSPKQISYSEKQRENIGFQMVSLIACREGDIGVRDILKTASLNNMMCSVFGRRYEIGNRNAETEELKELVDEGYELLGKLNLSDHLPWIASFDFQKIRFRCSQLNPKVNRFVNRIIEENKSPTDILLRKEGFVDVLLSLNGPDKLSDHDMVAVLWEMIFRGTDTVAVLIEWILARMVLHPDIQSKVHNELDQVVGRSRSLTESDIQSTLYLQAVIKEVLRLHPPGPLLSWARLAITDTIVGGYDVPQGTIAMVNMWAITRDPHVWVDPLKFWPERFMPKDDGSVDNGVDMDFSVLGSDLRLAPFGSGRRTCPGKALGLATVSYWVGTLLHEFEWVQLDNEPVDLSERLRLSCEMANPLKVKVHCRRNQTC